MKRLSPSSSTTTFGGGFSLLPLPPAPPHSHSKLRRCSSLPIDPVVGAPAPESIVGSVNGSGNQSPSPQGLALLRAVSDPNQIVSYGSPNPIVSYGSLNPNHMLSVVPKAGSRSPASGPESPASKRLKRMSERMKEMKQWFDQFIKQTDQDSDSKTESQGIDEAEDMNVKKNVESDSECLEEDKIISVDRQGDAMNIRFKCPCGDSYQILHLGQDYYYKLL